VKKADQQRHVAVDPLDQVAGRVRLVERQIEAQAVARQVGAQLVGGAPAHVLAEIDDGESHGALRQRHGDEQRGHREQGALRAARPAPRCVDEGAHDLRID